DLGQRYEFKKTLDHIRQGRLTEPELSDGIGFDAALIAFSDGRKLLIIPNTKSNQGASEMVDSSLVEFDHLKDKQVTVRQIGLLTLGVLTFLLIFASSWTAFYIARGLTVPIKALAEGADEIARGNFSHRVDAFAEDEIALLVSTFNAMSERLEENSAELRERRKYIETVLQALPTGVVSLDTSNRISTINKAAAGILGLEEGDFLGIKMDHLVGDENLDVLNRLIARSKRVGHASEHTVLTRKLADGNTEIDPGLPVAISATGLPDQNGAVLVIEDLSELIAAQRASAWREVARRMAHEIKNPLTPIQLSAERIAKRFVGQSPSVVSSSDTASSNRSRDNGQMTKVIDESTSTILREVQSLKSMVDEFSRFARLPDIKPLPGDLNEIIRKVLTLYRDRLPDIKILENLSDDLPETSIDAEQIKRVFVNLIDNAVEAFSGIQGEKSISITTRRDTARDIVVAEVADNAKGIDPGDLQKLFQPYFSTKGRGTGLGLAIVHRIVSDHRGKIKVAASQPKGTKFIIELPALG
ncbi:MAG: ATP-binding protein, partial [Pyrinomonadaceae bacterium]